MVEKAKVAIFEDNTDWQEKFKSQLTQYGHAVVLTAATYAEALEAITTFDELGVQIAIVDGNLSPNTDSGSEGQNLVRVIKQQTPHVKIVGMSADNNIFKGLVDANPGKYGSRIPLGELVNNL